MKHIQVKHDSITNNRIVTQQGLELFTMYSWGKDCSQEKKKLNQ